MSILDVIRPEAKDPEPVEIPSRILTRLSRGRERMRKGSMRRRLCMRFYRGEHYWFLNDKGNLAFQPTETIFRGGVPVGGKPPHRVRTSRNFIKRFVEEKVSACTQRIPSYQINPTSEDESRQEAADLGKKVLLFGYDKWRLSHAVKKVIRLAIVAEEGFAWPYFDTSVGPFKVDPASGELVGMGEIKVHTFSRNQVLWEPGVEFDESPWVAVERAMPVEDAKNVDGYIGGKLTADSVTGDSALDRSQETSTNLVLVTDYLERPCPDYPKGRWLTIANRRVIAGLDTDELTGAPQVRPYPMVDVDGNPIDEPVIHRLAYVPDPDNGDSMGLVWDLIDPMRTINDCVSKIVEWKNRCLNPRRRAVVGQQVGVWDDAPGGTDLYQFVGANVPPPDWETVPAIPASLFQLLQQTIQDMQLIAGSTSPPQGLEGEQAIEQSADPWQTFLGDLAAFHSRIGRHCLYLVARHYTDPRLIDLRGEFGWESIKGFRGMDLLGETNVRVLPESLVKVTQEQVQNELTFLASAFPGQLTLQQALASLHSGGTGGLLDAYQFDVARAELMIKRIKAGPAEFFATPMRMEAVPAPDGSVQLQEVEGWLPRKQDDAKVQMTVIAKYMKTPDFDSQPQTVQEAFSIYYDTLENLETNAQAAVAMAQSRMAQTYGIQNAGAPQQPPASPTLPSVSAPTPPPTQ